MTCTALITGASTGLGAEFARQLAAMGVDLVLVARDEDRLASLARLLSERHGVRAEALAADLTVTADLERVAARIRGGDDGAGERSSPLEEFVGRSGAFADRSEEFSCRSGAFTGGRAAQPRSSDSAPQPIDILINNAGFGVHAGFERSDLSEERRLHELLSWVPLRLAHAAVPGMLERGRGWILNVASVAAFTPSGTYGAAKAAVVSLSRSLNARYRRSGVRVTALCPGLLETEFHERMGVDHLPPLPRIAWASTSRAAREGLRAVRRGRAVVVSDWRYRLVRPLIAVLPDRVLERGAGEPGVGERGVGERGPLERAVAAGE